MKTHRTALNLTKVSNSFSIKFTKFMDGNKNVVVFDASRDLIESVEFRSGIRKSLAAYTADLFEFKSRTLSLDVIKKKIGGSLVVESDDQSDFSVLRHCIENAENPAVIIIYHCSELSASSVQLLAQLNGFLKKTDTPWKIIYLGQIDALPPQYIEQLAPELIYSVRRLTPTKPTTNNKTNLIGVAGIGLLGFICCVTALYLWWSNEPSGQSKEDTTQVIRKTQTTIEDDIKTWEVRLKQFDLAMPQYTSPSDSQRTTSNTSSKASDHHAIAISSDSIPRMSDELIIAAKTGNKELINTALSSGVAIDILDKNGQTLLILASLNGQVDLITWLLSKGASVSLVDSNQGSALYYAAANGHLAVAEKLLEYQANTTQSSSQQRTPLMAAVYNNYLELSALLVKARSNVNQQDYTGWTALYYAIWNGNVEITTLLLENGADYNLKDNDGYTPLDVAHAKSNNTILSLLYR